MADVNAAPPQQIDARGRVKLLCQVPACGKTFGKLVVRHDEPSVRDG